MTFAVVIATLVAFAVTPAIGFLAWRLNAVSYPDGQRRLHHRPTPVWGGIAVYLGLVAGITAGCFFGIDPALPLALIASAGILGLLGCYDDLYDMNARWKLLGQITAALPLAIVGYHLQRLTFAGRVYDVGWLGIPITTAWLVLGINAMNLIDGMDGLASTIGIAIALATAITAAALGMPTVVLLSLVLSAALAGFVFYNLPPARIYLGDCGSMLVGLTLALLAMQVAQTTPGTVNLTLTFVLFLIPLLDTTLAIVRRSLQGQGFMTADRGHIHHRLLDRGFSTAQALAILGSFCAITGAVGYLVTVVGHELWACAGLAAMILLAINLRLLGHEEWKLIWQRMPDIGTLFGQEPVFDAPTKRLPTQGLPHRHTSLSPLTHSDVDSAAEMVEQHAVGLEKTRSAA